jgi:outer membrane lipoprotein carrier protein
MRALLWTMTAVAAVWMVPVPSPQAQTPSAADLAQRLQIRYAAIRDFRADFTQTERGSVLRTVQTESRGTVRVKKPGRMWWDYQKPSKQVLVSDGTTLSYYNASDRTGVRSPMPVGTDLSAAVLFLTGRGDITRDFTAALLPTAPIDEWHLTLTPKVRQDDFATLTLQVDRTTLAFRGLRFTDHAGSENTIRFSNLRENVGLADADFRFTFPRGTHVTDSGRTP